jgi:hypothetical protein
MAESDKIQHPKKRAFLAAFEDCGSISRACKAAEINRSTHYEWLEDPDYLLAFEEAKENCGEELEAVARERAVKGSDTLLIFLLKGCMPEKYKDRVSQDVKHEFGDVPDEELDKRIAALEGRKATATSSE